MDRDVIAAQDELEKMKKGSGKKKTGRGSLPRIAGDNSPFLGIGQVLELIPIRRSSLYLKMKNGEFPLPKKLGGKAIAWSKAEVYEWIDKVLGQ